MSIETAAPIVLADGITVDVYHDPEMTDGEWTVAGDLRRPGSGFSDNANYEAAAAMRADHPRVAFDSESSCFFAYTATRELADRLVDALRQWVGERAAPAPSNEAGEALIARTAGRVGWLERAYKMEFTDPQRRCAAVLSTVAAPYNWATPTMLPGASLHVGDRWMSLLQRAPLSTFDNDTLTRMVFAGHDACVRVEIGPYAPYVDEDRTEMLLSEGGDGDYPLTVEGLQVVEIRVHARDRRDGTLCDRHPSLDTAVSAWQNR